jgi:phage-related protein
MGAARRRVVWVKSAFGELREFPAAMQKKIGFDLGLVQDGDMPDGAAQMHDIHPAVIELRAKDEHNAYRCIVTVRLKHFVYVLCAFQKKSTLKDKTPLKDIDLIRLRLKAAIELDAQFDREAAS